jgi:hypothetical protein
VGLHIGACSFVIVTMGVRYNKALHQTRRGGVAHFVRLGPVVEARLAGEGRC